MFGCIPIGGKSEQVSAGEDSRCPLTPAIGRRTEHWSSVHVWCSAFPCRSLRLSSTRWKTPSNSRLNWTLKWKLDLAGETCRTWSSDTKCSFLVCGEAEGTVVWSGQGPMTEPRAVGSSCVVFLQTLLQAAFWNAWWKLVWIHQAKPFKGQTARRSVFTELWNY